MNPQSAIRNPQFLSALIVRDDGGTFVLIEALSYESAVLGGVLVVLREAMDVCGVRRLQRWLIYSGLRIGGWVVWKRYRSASRGRGVSDTQTAG